MEQYIMKNQKQLRYGITTGTCAAAAARAAARHLLLEIAPEQGVVTVATPKGVTLDIAVTMVFADENACEYMVVKDSGDDPDVTDGAEIHARVERLESRNLDGKDLSKGIVPGQKDRGIVISGQGDRETIFHSEEYPNLYLEGGTGIGRVTKEGLEQAVGQAAINAVPRKMIFQAVGEVSRLAEWDAPLLITISVPTGEELAKRTFNPRLGIEGGISVLGTSGIIEPMSEKAIVDTIEIEIRQLAKQGEKRLLVTPGNYGQTYVSEYLHLDMEHGVKCSNYIGETIDLAISYGFQQFLLVGNIGKLVKLAAGIMNTHSKVADGRNEIIAIHTMLCGGTKEMAEQLMGCINTDEMLKHLTEWNLKEVVMGSICKKIEEHMEHRIGGKMQFGVMLFSEKYGYLGKAGEADIIVGEYQKG